MENIIHLPYSKNFAFIASAILLGLVIFVSYFLIELIPQDNATNAVIGLSLMDTFCFFIIIYFVNKYFIPALNGLKAIELNSEGIVDNIGNNKINWNNVSNIRLVIGGSTPFIAIDLKNNDALTSQTRNILKKLLYRNNIAFYQTPALIATQYIKGSRMEIFNIILNYFQQIKNSA